MHRLNASPPHQQGRDRLLLVHHDRIAPGCPSACNAARQAPRLPTVVRRRRRSARPRRPPLRWNGAPHDRYRWRERRSSTRPARPASPARLLPHRHDRTRGLDLAAPAHLRRVLQRADGRRSSSEPAHDPVLRPLEAAAAHGGRPGRLRGRVARVHAHFPGGGGGGTGPLQETNGWPCVVLHDEISKTSVSSTSNIISSNRYALSVIAVVSSRRLAWDRPPVCAVMLAQRPRPAAAAAAKMGAVVPPPPSHGLASPPSTRGRFVRPEARAVSRFFR